MNKIFTSFLLGASLLFTLPSAFAAKGEGGWQKHERHQNSRQQPRNWSNNKKHHRSSVNKKYYSNKHRSSRHNIKRGTRHGTKHTTKHGTKHGFRHNTRHGTKHNTRHGVKHNTRHGTKHITRHGTRHGIKHGPKKHINRHHNNRHITKRHIRKHYPRRHNRHSYYDDHSPFNSLFLSFFTETPVYDAPVYNAPVYNAPAYTTTYKSNIWDRQKNHQRRIRKGVKSGQLTHSEATFLRQELRRIRDRIAHYKTDGQFSHHDRKEIHRMLDRSDNHISQRKHNRVTRGDRQHNGGYDYYH